VNLADPKVRVGKHKNKNKQKKKKKKKKVRPKPAWAVFFHHAPTGLQGQTASSCLFGSQGGGFQGLRQLSVPGSGELNLQRGGSEGHRAIRRRRPVLCAGGRSDKVSRTSGALLLWRKNEKTVQAFPGADANAPKERSFAVPWLQNQESPESRGG